MSNVDSNSSLKEIAKQVRAEIKALKKAGQLDKDLKVSVRTSYFSQGCSLSVMVTACSFQIFDTDWVLWMEANPHGSMMDNPHPKYSDNARSVVETLDAIVAPFNWEDRDPQTDYYNCNFFFHGADFHWDLEKADKVTIKEANKAEVKVEAEVGTEAVTVAEVETVAKIEAEIEAIERKIREIERVMRARLRLVGAKSRLTEAESVANQMCHKRMVSYLERVDRDRALQARTIRGPLKMIEGGSQ